MLDEQEQFLLHQVRILLKQLEERQVTQENEEKSENRDDRYRTLLKLSCKNIWDFDPLTQMVRITCPNGHVIINSFRMLMQGVNADDHKRELRKQSTESCWEQARRSFFPISGKIRAAKSGFMRWVLMHTGSMTICISSVSRGLYGRWRSGLSVFCTSRRNLIFC